MMRIALRTRALPLLLAVALSAPASAQLVRRNAADGRARGGWRLVPVHVSARHCHLSAGDLATLFGPGHALTKRNALTQTGQFACEETVTAVGPRGRIELRILGPTRGQTQVEVSRTDARTLGVGKLPVRLSGALAGTPGLRLEGPAGSLELPSGLIVARRHLHAAPADAKRLGFRNGSLVSVRVGGRRGVVFSGVKVRVDPRFRLDFHLDTDEGNAASIDGRARGLLLPK